MANLSCQIRRNLDARLTEAANERKLDGLEPYSKSGIVSEALEIFLQENTTPEDIPRNTSDRVSRNFQVDERLKRKLARKVMAVKARNNISHYAAFGGWIEVAVERWLTDNAETRRRREGSGARE